MEDRQDDDAGDASDADGDEQQGEVDPNDSDLPMRHSALLLLLRCLAVNSSLVHLELEIRDITPFVMDRMPVWPHLRYLSVADNDELVGYTFDGAAARFPSLTSLSSPCCSHAAIAQLIRLPALEELRFPEYYSPADRVPTTERGFRAQSQAAYGDENDMPSLVSMTALSTPSLARPVHHQPAHAPNRQRPVAERGSSVYSSSLSTASLTSVVSSSSQRTADSSLSARRRMPPCCRSSSRSTSSCPADRRGRLHAMPCSGEDLWWRKAAERIPPARSSRTTARSTSPHSCAWSCRMASANRSAVGRRRSRGAATSTRWRRSGRRR